MSLKTGSIPRFGLVRSYPADLGAVTGIALLCFAIGWTQPSESIVRMLMAMGFVLFLPGYAVVSVLFPGRARFGHTAGSTRFQRLAQGIDTSERFGLSFALSLVISAMIALLLPFTEWGLTHGSILASLTGTTIVLSQIAVIRRKRVPIEERYTVRPLSVVSNLKRSEGIGVSMSSVVLGFAILAGTGMLVIALVSPLSVGGFTEMGLYTEEEGELVAGNIPDEIEPGESISVMISIDNQEGTETDYAIVVQEQVLNDATVVDRTDHDTIDVRLEDGESELTEYEVTPTGAEGDTVRIAFLLFQDRTPAQPTTENSDQYTYFWVTTESDDENSGDGEGEDEGDVDENDGTDETESDGTNDDEPGVAGSEDGEDGTADDNGDTDDATGVESLLNWLFGSEDDDDS